MVEMRWVQTGDGHEDNPLERTLQYRVVGSGFVEGNELTRTWGPWQDIPVVDRKGFTLGYSGAVKVE